MSADDDRRGVSASSAFRAGRCAGLADDDELRPEPLGEEGGESGRGASVR
jgi:hypothetical protein